MRAKVRIKAGSRCEECEKIAEKVNPIQPASAKIRMLVELLKAVKLDEKTIVFSQFTSFLNLIEPFLKDHGIRYVRCESVGYLY